MTKAAEELFIAQPSLSKTIRRLEKEIGVPLFDRQERSLQLNQFGKAFLEHIEAMFYELEEGQRKVRDMAGLEQGVVSLIAASLPWIPDLLHRFQVLHPSIHFRLSQCPLAEIPQQLETGAYDFCFLSTPLARSGIKWRPLLTDEILLVVPSTHRLVGQKHIPLREVAREAVVIEKVGSGLRDLIDTFCQQAGITLSISYEIDEPAMLYEFVKAGLGVGFTPAMMKKQANEQLLSCIHLTNPTCKRTLGLAWQEKHYLSQAALTFRQFVMDYFANLEQGIS
ncbi:LysR family transcriptional regulator [Dictyobacter sp. S3.2.2.5]|uniref:LysR family transcriptional regulator n=2 Tax=Dictyobacter halimunensis TaxID=3026934 RepID=A0ABQ6G4W1_9CHLR|nr:LysR family transcriptional regulator [Dictyobacter sp. S3.2.2.5]